MPIEKILVKKEVEFCICDKCGHKWVSRIPEVPVACPGCKSTYWNKPRMRKKRKKKEVLG